MPHDVIYHALMHCLLQIDYLCILYLSYTDFYNSLPYTFFIFTNNFFPITKLAAPFEKSISVSKILSVRKLKISFTEVFHES